MRTRHDVHGVDEGRAVVTLRSSKRHTRATRHEEPGQLRPPSGGNKRQRSPDEEASLQATNVHAPRRTRATRHEEPGQLRPPSGENKRQRSPDQEASLRATNVHDPDVNRAVVTLRSSKRHTRATRHEEPGQLRPPWPGNGER